MKITTYAMQQDYKTDVNANVITAVTDQEIRDARRGWAKMGFLSRFIVVSYTYNLSTITEILGYYSEHGLTLRRQHIEFPEEPTTIVLSKALADKLDPIAVRIGKQYDLHGIRAKINFRCLLKCLALRNGRTTVTEAEFQAFLELADFMNFKYNPI